MKGDIEFKGRARYCIVIQGRPSLSLTNQFKEANVGYAVNQKGQDETHLQIEILDQAHLSGILNAIYTQQLPLIKVQWMGDDDFAET